MARSTSPALILIFLDTFVMTSALTSVSSTTAVAQLEQRRQMALEIATRCQQTLKDQFGATEVILFGSLRGDSVWHGQSDIDIAVAGLSWENWLEAQEILQKLAPEGLKIDLVQLETVSPRVRTRILQEKPMPQNLYLALKEHLEDELVALEKNATDIRAALDRAGTNLDEYNIRAVASYVIDFYKRCERISRRVAVTLDEQLPQGDNWHEALLQQVAEPTENRPVLWSPALQSDLDQYRKFRHIVHHKYGDQLRSPQVVALAENACSVFEDVQRAITQFSQWLVQQVQS
ncbi:MAG: nucleotidyltransferase family protein [Microcoleaceae cyanobacterium]